MKKKFKRFHHVCECEIMNPIAPPSKVLKSDGLFSVPVEEKPVYQSYEDYSIENQLKAGVKLDRVVVDNSSIDDLATGLNSLENINLKTKK